MPDFNPDFTLDGDKITDVASFYDEIAKVCKFPDYFGRNLDALNDCLYDLSCTNPGATIWWANVHPYLKSLAWGNPKQNLLEHMKDICDGHGLRFCA